jgi:hypothetical protein
MEYPGAIYHEMNHGDRREWILQEEPLGWTARNLAAHSTGDVRKARLARRLRTETGVTWISQQLPMGTWMHAASPVAKLKIEPGQQNEFKLE